MKIDQFLWRAALWLCLGGAWWCGTGCRSTERTLAGPTHIRVMTFNIHHGEGMDGRIDLERIARIVTEHRADLVAVQEVDRGLTRSQGRDMPAELAALTGLRSVFRNNYSTLGGEYGNAVLSRFPIVTVTNIALPKVTAVEPRGLLQVTVLTPAGPLQFWATHLDHRRNEPDRPAQVDFILQHLPDVSEPLLVAGDFNLPPTSDEYRRLGAALEDAWTGVGAGPGWTIPSEKPNRRIDYVWHGRTGRLRPVQAEVISSDASDHRPVLVEFEFRPLSR